MTSKKRGAPSEPPAELRRRAEQRLAERATGSVRSSPEDMLRAAHELQVHQIRARDAERRAHPRAHRGRAGARAIHGPLRLRAGRLLHPRPRWRDCPGQPDRRPDAGGGALAAAVAPLCDLRRRLGPAQRDHHARSRSANPRRPVGGGGSRRGGSGALRGAVPADHRLRRARHRSLPSGRGRHHRPQENRGAGQGRPEDGGHRKAGGRRRPRLQQPAHRDPGECRERAGAPARGLSSAREPARAAGRGRAWGGADPPAPGLRPQAGAADQGRRREPARAQRLEHAAATRGRRHRDCPVVRGRPGTDPGRSDAARPGPDEPRDQRPRRHARRGDVDPLDRERGARSG